MEKIQDERKDVKKIKTRESNSCPLLAGSTSSKLKEKNQVGQQGDLNFVRPKCVRNYKKQHIFENTIILPLLDLPASCNEHSSLLAVFAVKLTTNIV